MGDGTSGYMSLDPCPVYYNEFDREKVEWLRQLIGIRAISAGEVDGRSIHDVMPGDVSGLHRAHFFAGIGIWDYALNLARWPEEWPIWTASCPCQPYSVAGKGLGDADHRDLWPELFAILQGVKHPPHVIVGEQVSSADGLKWLDVVSGDLEGEGYAFAAIDSCSAGVGAPHIRQRLYWCGIRVCGGDGVADTEHSRCKAGGSLRRGTEAIMPFRTTERVEYAPSNERKQWRAESGKRGVERGCGVDGLGDTQIIGRLGWSYDPDLWRRELPSRPTSQTHFWSEPDWVLTRPQRVGDSPGLRPVRPGAQCLVDGDTAVMGPRRHPGFPLAEKEEAMGMRLHGYGDAINAYQAAAWVTCVLEEVMNGW